MSSSKIRGTDEWSSNESGWTAYIASPERDEDEEDRSRNKQEKEEADSDDSMVSDASSCPSVQYGYASRYHGLGQGGSKKEGRHGKKEKQQEVKKKHDHDKKKAAQDKADSAARSRKR